MITVRTCKTLGAGLELDPAGHGFASESMRNRVLCICYVLCGVYCDCLREIESDPHTFPSNCGGLTIWMHPIANSMAVAIEDANPQSASSHQIPGNTNGFRCFATKRSAIVSYAFAVVCIVAFPPNRFNSV